ncbi:MAG TPA: serine hydrolase domain-containing protein [Polyangiales bacterium]|nr:serine hydrolase domain-containing protein [Polyangiales bacterium]
MNKALEKNLDAALDAAIDQQRVVGGVVVVLRDGVIAYRRAVGLADRESGTSMQVDTIFRLASITKPIASVAAMRLVEAGKLDLAAPITRYLPEFRPKLGDREPEITVRQLLTHTSGLSYAHMQPKDGPYLKLGISDGMDQPGLALDEELRRLVAAGLFSEPGTQWGYSLGIDVVGAAIEKVTGKPLPAAIKELVTGPLDMVRTTFEAPADKPLATPYADGTPPVRMGDPQVVPFFDLSGIRFSPSRTFDPKSFPSAGAGMNGTADEVARLLELVRSGGGKLLKQETSRAMLTNQTGALPVVLGPGWGFGFGGAVLLDPRAAQTPESAGTWMWGGVWGHSWFVDPVQRLVVVGLTNTAIEGMMGRFPTTVRDAVYASLAS